MGKTAAFWEGYQAFQTRKECRYGVEIAAERKDWAKGFAYAERLDRGGKVWYRSRTLWGCMLCALAGVGLLIYGQSQGPSGVYMAGAGTGLSAGGIFSTLMRLVTREAVTFGSGFNNGPTWPPNN